MLKIIAVTLISLCLFAPPAFSKTIEELDAEVRSIQSTLVDFQQQLNKFQQILRSFQKHIDDAEFQTGSPETTAGGLR